MSAKKTIFFTVTNDLIYDQRMIRICTSLSNSGFAVTLVGIRTKNSGQLNKQAFAQKRLFSFFSRGKLFYAEFNIRLFFYLLFQRMDAICAIDLDTILPCYLVSICRRITRIYDAHELFCEMKEIVTRPAIHRVWKRIERFAVPRFRNGYTVSQPIAAEFERMYGVDYVVIRNLPLLKPLLIPEKTNKYIIYQGAVNEGRSFETLIPAMKQVNAPLVICGDGNFMKQTKQLVRTHGLEDKVTFTGRILPGDLAQFTLNAWVGVALVDDHGLNNYYSLANRFFDYLHAGIPQLCVNYPVYREINNQYHFAVLIEEVSENTVARHLNQLLEDVSLYRQIQQHCLEARLDLNWQEEEKKLILFYQTIL